VACETTIIDRYETPPDILSYLSRRLVTPTRPFPSLSTPIRYNSEWGSVHPYRQTELICEIYDRLAVSPSHPSLHSRASETILCMVENGLNAEWLADLPPGVALPIHEMIRSCQTSSVPNLPPRAYEFIGRSDLSTQSRGDVTVSRDIPTAEVSTTQACWLMSA